MLIKAILTTLVLGMSSAAMAQTYQPTYEHNDAYDYNQHYSRGRFARRAFVLANNVTLTADRQASFIRIDPRFRVSRVRLDLTGGRAYIDSVFVTHADGRQETVAVGQMISPRMPRLVIDLPGRDITGVAINSSQMRAYARGGGYRRMHTATVNVIGVRR